MLVLSFDYPPCIPFTLSPCPDTLEDYFGLSRVRCLCARTVCSEIEMKDALFIPTATVTCSCHTIVPSTHIQMLKCWACAIIPVEFECRKAAVVLTRTTIHYVTEAWASPN